MHEEVNVIEPTEEYFKLKEFIEVMFGLIFRKLCKERIICKLPTGYLLELASCLRVRFPTPVWEDSNIMDISCHLVINEDINFEKIKPIVNMMSQIDILVESIVPCSTLLCNSGDAPGL